MNLSRPYVILAIDDDTNVLDLLKDTLANVPGIKLNVASNSFFAGAKLMEEKPDLIILDFIMPELDGFEFCRFVRQDPRFKDIPVLAVTALHSEKDFDHMRNNGVSDILSKPFPLQALMEKIDRFRATN